MVPIPLAMTGEYVQAWDGEYASVLIRLNGIPLISIVSDDPIAAMYPGRQGEAVEDAVRTFVSQLIHNMDGVSMG